MKLEVTIAEQQQQLGRMEELEKELQHHRLAVDYLSHHMSVNVVPCIHDHQKVLLYCI